MPYSVPTPPPTTTNSTDLPQLITHSQGRPGHRRSYSASHPTTTTTTTYNFSDERFGPGAFSPLGSLPRRTRPTPTSTSSSSYVAANGRATSATAKRFQIRGGEDDLSSSSEVSEDEEDGALGNTLPPLKLKVKPGSPASFGLKLNTGNVVPFPRSSPLSSPLPGSPSTATGTGSPKGLLSPLSPGSSIGNLHTLSIDTRNPKYSPTHLAPNANRPSPSRTSSSPVILLSNGKPLKSSLKSSSSTSNIPSNSPLHQTSPSLSYHTRARSAPSTPGTDLLLSPTSSTPGTGATTPITPNTPKNVHFPSLSSDLERVRVFNRSAKPASLLGVNMGDETETETETETQNGTGMGKGMWGGSAIWGAASHSRGAVGMGGVGGYPFPKVSTPTKEKEKETNEKEGGGKEYAYAYEIDTAGYPLPSVSLETLLSADANINVLLEKFELVDRDSQAHGSQGHGGERGGERGLSLRGSLVVRNLAYEKGVWVRFTLDEWSTVSEVRASWAESIPLGPLGVGKATVGDVVASTPTSTSTPINPINPTAGESQQTGWDRFAFAINLEDYRYKLDSRVVWLVGRFSVPSPSGGAGGEWWDNCQGRNWRVGFRRVGRVDITKDEGRGMRVDKEKEGKEERVERVGVVPNPTASAGSTNGRRGFSLSAPAATLTQPPPELVAATNAAAAAGFVVVPGTTVTTTTTVASSSSGISTPSPGTATTSESPVHVISTTPTSTTPTTPTTPATPNGTPPPPDRKHVEALASATEKRLRRFSLSNYVKPGSVGVASSGSGAGATPASPKEPKGSENAKNEQGSGDAKDEGKDTVVFPTSETSDSPSLPTSEGQVAPPVPAERERERERKEEMVSPEAPDVPLALPITPIAPTSVLTSIPPTPKKRPFGLYWPWGAGSGSGAGAGEGVPNGNGNGRDGRLPASASVRIVSSTSAPAPAAPGPEMAMQVVQAVAPEKEDLPMLERSGSVSSASTSSVDSLFLFEQHEQRQLHPQHLQHQQHPAFGVGEHEHEGHEAEFGFGVRVDGFDSHSVVEVKEREDMKTPVPGEKFRIGSGWEDAEGEGEGDSRSTSGSGSPVEAEVEPEAEVTPPIPTKTNTNTNANTTSISDSESGSGSGSGSGTETATLSVSPSASPLQSISPVSLSPLSPLPPSLTAPLTSSLSPNVGGIDSDSLYKAFVRQWCFAESGPGTGNGTGHGHGNVNGNGFMSGGESGHGHGHGHGHGRRKGKRDAHRERDAQRERDEYEYVGGSLGLEVSG